MKITIITINFNNSAGLQKTLESVSVQTYRDYEYIIIDGGSTDSSVEIIRQFSNFIHCWISEKDKGIYHAMNKGIDKATGDYLLFLNSGDHLYSNNTLEQFVAAVHDEDLVYGHLFFQGGQGESIVRYPSTLSFSHFLSDSLPHPATLIKKSLFDFCRYNESFKIVSDWELFVYWICKKNVSYKRVDQVVSVYDTGGLSSNAVNAALVTNERTTVLESHYKAFLNDYSEFFGISQNYKSVTTSKTYKKLERVSNIFFLRWLKKVILYSGIVLLMLKKDKPVVTIS